MGALPMFFRDVHFGDGASSPNDSGRASVFPSLAEQITPVLALRLGRNGIAGISCTLAPSFNNRADRIVTWYDSKAGYGWERWL